MKKILIVEDEAVYTALLHATLRPSYEIHVARDGAQGLTMALREQPDLIILDVEMPQMDGITMLRELRKDPYGKHMDVIFFAGHEPEESIIEQIINDRPLYYWVKSTVRLVDIVARIHNLLYPGNKLAELGSFGFDARTQSALRF